MNFHRKEAKILNEILEFEILDANIERLIDNSTALCSLRIITEGSNRHNLPMSLDVIKDAAERTLRGKPILASYSNWYKDLESHKEAADSEAIGYIVENQTFEYKTVEENKKALFAKAILWKRYAPKQVGSLFEADNHTKKVSMEIEITELIDKDDKSKGIAAFNYLGICVLGERFLEASPQAHATLLTFSAMKEKYETMLFSSKPKFTIDNSVESAFMDETKPTSGRSLYSKIIDQPNAEYFAKEIYLDADTKWFENPSKSISPHHKWRGNVLCLSRVGLEQEMAKLQAENITAGESYEHLRRHFSELGMEDVFSKNFEKKEEETLEEKVMMEDAKEEVMAAPEQEAKEEEKPEAEGEKKEEVDYAAKIMDYEAKIKEYACGVEKYEAELGELRKFKADREEQDRLFQVEKLFSEVGDSLPKEKAEEFREEAKSLQFSEIAAFSNKVKACTFEVMKNTGADNGVKRMAVATPEKVEKKSVWGF